MADEYSFFNVIQDKILCFGCNDLVLPNDPKQIKVIIPE